MQSHDMRTNMHRSINLPSLFQRNRDSLITAYLDAKNSPIVKLPRFTNCQFPEVTNRIVAGIASARHIDVGLPLLGWFAAIAGADRGLHRVILRNTGYINSLSLIIMASGEPGCGKSLALQDFTEFFIKKEKENHLPSEELKKIITIQRSRIKALEKQFIKTGDSAKLDEAKKIEEKLKEDEMNLNKHDLVFNISDITAPSYLELMKKQGFALRMESDGVLLPRSTFDMIRKFWSGETHSQDRISRDRIFCHDPFLVDLVFTQMGPFTKFVQTKEIIDTGLFARMLIYHAETQDSKRFQTPKRKLDNEVKSAITKTLERIMHSADTRITGQHNDIFLTQEAESAWLKFDEMNKEDALDYDIAIEDWARRAGQHALRIAGILHVAENYIPSQHPITTEEINTAFEILNNLREHAWQCRAGYTNEREKECECDTALSILNENMEFFSETQLKQRLKDKFTANEVQIALFKIEQAGIIKNTTIRDEKRLRGRPMGQTFKNCYHERFIR